MFKVQSSKFKVILIGLCWACIEVSAAVNIKVQSLDEQYSSNTQQTALRIRLINEGKSTLKQVRVSYFLKVDSSQALKLEPYDMAGLSYFKSEPTGTGWTRLDLGIDSLPPGLYPSTSGLCLGLHYQNWQAWNKDDDFSQPESDLFQNTQRIAVYEQDSLVAGSTPALYEKAADKLRIGAFQPEGQPNDPAWVEIVNQGVEPLYLGAWQLQSGETRFALPSISLPAGKRLKLESGTYASCDDQDLSDSNACMVAEGLSLGVQGELMLVMDHSPISYVAWGKEGAQASLAMEKGLWSDTQDFLTTLEMSTGPTRHYTQGSLFSKAPGTDGKAMGDWIMYSPDEEARSSQGELPSPVGVYPWHKASLVQKKGQSQRFSWVPMPEAESYRFQLWDKANQKLLRSENTSQNYVDVSLSEGTYQWNVEVSSIAAGFAAKTVDSLSIGLMSEVTVAEEKPSYAKVVDLQVESLPARRDTRLVDIGWGNTLEQNHWDSPHDTASNWDDEESWRCWVVSVHMLNRYYGGNLTQDEIKVHIKYKGSHPILNSFMHFSSGGGDSLEIASALSWALNITPKEIQDHPGSASIDQIKNALDNGRPLYILNRLNRTIAHAMVIDAYRLDENGDMDIHSLNTDNNGKDVWSHADSAMTWFFWFEPIVQQGKVRQMDPRLEKDSDGDSLLDFDEEERFHTDPQSVDSDKDSIEDKIEIRAYTLRIPYPKESTLYTKYVCDSLADVDRDTLRAELDNDSDNDLKPDGAEDTNHNGIREAGESDPFTVEEAGSLVLPEGWALYALNRLRVNDGAQIGFHGTGGEFYFDVAAGSTDDKAAILGVSAKVRNLYSQGGAWLRERATVTSQIVTNGPIEMQPKVTVRLGIYGPESGTIFGRNQALPTFPASPSLTDYQVPESSLIVGTGEKRNLTPSESYRSVKVENGGTLVLEPGAIYIGSLQMESGSNLQLASLDKAHRTVLHLNGSCIWHGNMISPQFTANNFALIQHGSSEMYMDGTWAGTLIAPYSHVVIAQAEKKNYGAVLGLDIDVHQNSTFVYQSLYQPIKKESL